MTALTGPVTDNLVGKQYIENALGVSAYNARSDAQGLGEAVYSAVSKQSSAQKSKATHALGLVV
jgi:hypothetical protein